MAIKGSPALQLLTAYRLVKQVTLPWIEWEAYKLGLISKEGKKLKKTSSQKDHESLPIMTVLAMNIKRIIQRLPGGGSKFATLAAALFLLKEEADLGDETILTILEQLGVDIEYPDPCQPPIHESETIILGDRCLRHCKWKTNESFLGHWSITEGKDIITGETVRFLTDENGAIDHEE